MDLIDRFNSKFGRWYEGLFGADTGDLRPRDVLRKIITAMEDNRREGLDRNVYVPNRYDLHIAVADQAERDYLLSFLDEDELVGVLTKFMAQNGYHTRGPLDFTISEVPAGATGLPPQKISVTARFEKSGLDSQPPPSPRGAVVKPAVSPDKGKADSWSRAKSDGEITLGEEEPETVPLIARAGLAITSPDGKKRHYTLSRQRVMIGRSRHAANDVILDDDGMVSKVHARIEWEPNRRCRIYDLESTNGVTVNGKKIETDSLLHDGDLLIIGATTLTFEQDDLPGKRKPSEKMDTVSAPFLLDPDGNRHYLSDLTEIGSALTSDLLFTGNKVSSRHALIIGDEAGRFYLAALSDDQKTEHNGRPLFPGARTLLAEGDRITFGTLELVFTRAVS